MEIIEAAENGRSRGIRAAELTHPGLVRLENQDKYCSFLCSLGNVYLVADGMGGHAGGARGAELAVELIQSKLTVWNGDPSDPDALREALSVAFRAANSGIHAEGKTHPEVSHMGSTAVLAVIQDSVAYIAHVGDSRAYLWRQGELKSLTIDHSVTGPLVASGALTEEEARHHYQAGVLTKALGPLPVVEPSIYGPIEWERGDLLLLCSDGLCGYISNDVIGAVLAAETDVVRASDRLLNLALEAGGEDNITIVAIAAEPTQHGWTSATLPHAEAIGTGLAGGNKHWSVRKWVGGGLLLLAAATLALDSYQQRLLERGAAVELRVEASAAAQPGPRKPLIRLVCLPGCRPSGRVGDLIEELSKNPKVDFKLDVTLEPMIPGVYALRPEDKVRAQALADQLKLTFFDSFEDSLRPKIPEFGVLIVLKGQR